MLIFSIDLSNVFRSSSITRSICQNVSENRIFNIGNDDRRRIFERFFQKKKKKKIRIRFKIFYSSIQNKITSRTISREQRTIMHIELYTIDALNPFVRFLCSCFRTKGQGNWTIRFCGIGIFRGENILWNTGREGGRKIWETSEVDKWLRAV